MNIFDPKYNGRAKDVRHYLGSIFVFLFVVGIIITLLQYPVLETNKETVLMLIGSISASLPLIISSIIGAKPDDVNAMKQTIEKKENQIELLVKAKDDLEGMVINLQKQMLENQDMVLDRVVLKAAIDFDEKYNPPKK